MSRKKNDVKNIVMFSYSFKTKMAKFMYGKNEKKYDR